MNKFVYGSMVLALTFPLIGFAEEATTTTTTMTTQSGTQAPKGGMDGVTKALHIGMNKLSSTDKSELIKMIQDYLTSKGIEIPADIRETRKDIKEARKNSRDEIKEMRKNTKDAIKAKREETRNKIKTIRENRKNGSGSTMTSTLSGTITQ